MDYKNTGISGARGEYLALASCLGCAAVVLQDDIERHDEWHRLIGNPARVSRREEVQRWRELNAGKKGFRSDPYQDEFFWAYDIVLKKVKEVSEDDALKMSRAVRWIVFSMTPDEMTERSEPEVKVTGDVKEYLDNMAKAKTATPELNESLSEE